MTENRHLDKLPPILSSIAPWLTVSNGVKAVDFYQAAFEAIVTYRLESPGGGLIAKLSVDGAEFWLNGESENEDLNSHSSETPPVRMILTVNDPDTVFDRALKSGAMEVFPVGEEFGWRLGRIVDPFGYHWEIGRPL